MPKQHRSRALLVKPTSSAPANLKAGEAATTSTNDEYKSRSVNELLREARRAGPSENGGSRAQTSWTAPPTLRPVSGGPSSDIQQQPRAPTRVRRIPGPPPPRSWLEDSQHAPNSNSVFQELRWARARIQQQPATLPGTRFPDPTSLLHTTLKRIATNWAWHAEYDSEWFLVLPETLREVLLDYISIYDDHRTNPMPVLFPADSEKKDLDKITRLDLSNALGAWASMKKIERELIAKPEVIKNGLAGIQPETAIPDSWDADDDTTDISPTLKPVLRFSNLRHLSLAVNPCTHATAPSWQGLLAVAPYLSRITSLSLANWTRPTYTPNASRHYVRISDNTRGSAPAVTYGGTNYYSTYDDDWQEAVGILKSLSRYLHALTWLDLSGCSEWFPALTWHGPVGGDVEHYIPPIDWNGSWRNIKTLILMVGWLPASPISPQHSNSAYSTSSSVDSSKAIEQLYGNSERIQQSLTKLSALRLESRPDLTVEDKERWNVEREREKTYYKRDVARYRDIRGLAKSQAAKIRQLRAEGGGGWLDVEFGEVLDEVEG